MNFKEILKTVGSGLISTLVPGGSAIIEGINAFLPVDKKLPENSTGIQAQNAISNLSPEVQQQVLTKKYDVKVEEIRGFTDRFKAMAEVDKTGNTTRPAIAMMMAKIISFAVIAIISVFTVAVINNDTAMIKSIVDGWPFIVAILGTPTALIRSYFAMRTKEKQQKYEAATGTSAPVNLLASLFKK